MRTGASGCLRCHYSYNTIAGALISPSIYCKSQCSCETGKTVPKTTAYEDTPCCDVAEYELDDLLHRIGWLELQLSIACIERSLEI